MARKFLLCFHDFSVWNYQKVTPILEKLKDLAGAPFSILVIPDTETAPSDTVRDFRATLTQLKSEDFELALHGFKHKAEFSQGRSYAGLIAMNLTQGEAEFAGLSEFESSRLLHAGLDAWEKLFEVPGLVRNDIEKPAAFIPPTWYSNKFLPTQVHAEKMLYEDRFALVTSRGKRYASPVASFAGIPGFMTKTAFKFGDIILKVPVGLPRIALHPEDFPQHEIQIKNLIRTALGCGRRLTQYKDL
ncbi:polysaccharide deacetylase family protein [Fibrobacter sp.]|uniref:polysaccharide deacetylase family protein n=1 Tax=Fibrobacter sp. TaxID=35828 RepID=UPI0025B9DF5F|nr:polysaccharide deacetylase family protein [Fibrobacter sp.]MCI6437226.1 polysaccharide deacetylase family protein [Fibrobacter sp.]MDD7498218.1 polysaccharide deacetylase family protein [Fibrobacter sp.]MDY5724592.1 polysaccharide deacetylase family protein [Fibrobacter sp.]